jgi:hypothetical protein
MALLGTLLHSDEKSHVEIYCQRKHRFNILLLAIRNFRDHPQNNSQSHLKKSDYNLIYLMTIRLAERSTTIFVESNVRCAGTENCHISEGYSQKTSIRDSLYSRLKEWHCSAVGI